MKPQTHLNMFLELFFNIQLHNLLVHSTKTLESNFPYHPPRNSKNFRRWLRAYLNGCAFKIFDVSLGPSLRHVPFAEAAEWLYRSSGFALIGAALLG